MITTQEYSVLTVKQPWVHFIFNPPFWKNIENRSWSTPYRGPLLIHASKSIDTNWQNKLDPQFIRLFYKKVPPLKLLPTSCLIGFVILDFVVKPLKKFNLWHQEECYGHHYTCPIDLIKQIPYQGQLGIFKIPFSSLPLNVFGIYNESRKLFCKLTTEAKLNKIKLSS